MFQKIEWLFFDVGSTLIDEQIVYAHRLKDIARSSGQPYEQVYQFALARYKENLKGDLEAARHFDVPLPKWHTEDEQVYPEAKFCLRKLHQYFQIGIIANQPTGTRTRLESHGLLPYIDLIITSAEEGVSKPDSRIFQLALNRSGCIPQKAVMIGDRIDNDIIPAKRLGMKTVWIKQGFGRYWQLQHEFEQPDTSVENLMELTGILAVKKEPENS